MARYVAIFVLFLLIVGVAGSAFVVDEREQVIITQFGKPVPRSADGSFFGKAVEAGGGAITKAGLHFKIPVIQKVRRFDRRFLEWDGERNQLPTKDKRFIFVDTYARWQIIDPLKYFERLRDEQGARRRLDDILDGETRNAIANYNLVEAVRTSNRQPEEGDVVTEETSVLEPIDAGREKIRLEILEKAQSRTSDLGIEILDVQFKRINYAEKDVRKALEDRMIAERQRIAARYRSEGEGEASRIRGEMERELSQIISEAYKTAEEIRGRADAEATRIYAEAYDQSRESREFYELLKTLETYKKTFDADTTVVLSTKGDFFRFLKKAGG
ncbi:MAG: protease modulator HflC [Deltaproteobacteria bacterium]|nr:protease modulator HflC [Deltaproteobacteria bacterium]